MAKTNRQSYGLGSPLHDMNPNPIPARRAPTAGDTNYVIGQVWIDRTNDDVYILTNTAAGAATWVLAATSLSDLDRLTPDAGTSPVVPDASHNIGISAGTQGPVFTGGVAQVTMSFPYLEMGTTASPATTFGDNNRALQIIRESTGIAVGTSLNAFRAQLTQLTGDGTESPIASRGALTVGAAGNIEDAYGGYFTATQTDGSEIDSNLIGSLALTTINETDAADQPQQWIAGSQSIVWFDAAAAVPTATIVCANLNHVMYDAAMNDIGHGVVVSRNGGGAGATAGSAFKVVAGGGIADFAYGCDLYTDGAGAAALYGAADIRLANETTIDSTATDVTVTVPDTLNYLYSMTDAEHMQVLNTVDGTFASAIEAIEGNFVAASGASILQPVGVYGYCEQADGSAITSTAAGIEGELNLIETDNADLPPVYAFGVKGYLNGLDATGIPAGITAGIGSVVEYITPFNAKAYGVAVSRLDAAGGTGTAGQAAFGAIQGTVAIADWLYGLDLSGATSGFTNADVIFSNSSTIAVDTEGVTFSGDVSARGSYASNSWMVPITSAPVMATKANTGGVPTGATGDENLMVMQQGEILEQHINGAGQTIIAPVMDATGLLISLDLTNDEGAEYAWGILGTNRHAYTIGTDAAFFFKCKIKIADATGADPVYIGFRKQEAYQGTFTAYTDYAFIGVEETQNSELITIADELNSGGTTYTNTTDAWTDGQTKTLTVNVSAAGVVTYLIDGVAPTATHAFTFDNGDVVMPCIHFLHGAAAPGAIHLIDMECGYQAWN